MNKKNPLLTDTEELFRAGTGNLAEFEHRLCKQNQHAFRIGGDGGILSG